MKEKKKYSRSDLEIIEFCVRDIVSTSEENGGLSNDKDKDYESGGWT